MALALISPTTGVVAGVVVFVVVGLLGSVSKSDVYDEIGQSGLWTGAGPEGAADPTAAHTPGSAAERAEQEVEIRQMLQARNERLERKGMPPLDIDAEIARLLDPPAAATGGAAKRDPMLVEEVRQLVQARNERRARRGEPPLDVEEEVQRTLAELDPDG